MSRATVFTAIWKNLVKSLRPRQITGNFMGEDYFGNRYYEIPIQENSTKRRPERWFVPPGNNVDKHFDAELTAEWESWLRHRRAQPPTDEELKRNLAVMQMKKLNAAELDEKYSEGKESDPSLGVITGLKNFPTYDEYETVVGKKPSEQNKKPHVLDRLK